MRCKSCKVVINKAVDAVNRDYVFKALVVQGQGVDDGFGQDNGLGAVHRLAVDQAGPGTGKIKMRCPGIFADVAAVKVFYGAVGAVEREHHAVVEEFVALGV